MLIRLALFRSTESLFMFSSLSFLSLGHDFIVQISFLYWCSGFLVGLVPFFLYNSRWVCSRYIPFFGSLFYLFSLLRVCSWIIPYSYVLSLLVQVSSYYLTTFLVLSFFLVAATLGGQVPMTLPSTYQRFHVFRIIPHSYVLLPLIWVSPYCLTIFLDPSFLVTCHCHSWRTSVHDLTSFYSLLVSGPMFELQQLQMCSLTLCLLSYDNWSICLLIN